MRLDVPVLISENWQEPDVIGYSPAYWAGNR